MKIIPRIVFFVLIGISLSRAETKTATPTVTDTPVVLSSPTITPTPIRAPRWAPSAAGPVPAEAQAKGKSPWMSSIGLGVGLPVSPHLEQAYTLGFNVNLGAGYKVNDAFSVWLDVALDLFSSKNDVLTQDNKFTLINASLWVKYRFLTSDFSPYLFAGPGLAYNENRSDQAPIYDPDTGIAYSPINAYEVDFLAEGGLGLEIKMAQGASAYLQTRLTYDFVSTHFANYAYTDSPIVIVPLEAGVLFGF